MVVNRHPCLYRLHVFRCSIAFTLRRLNLHIHQVHGLYQRNPKMQTGVVHRV